MGYSLDQHYTIGWQCKRPVLVHQQGGSHDVDSLKVAAAIPIAYGLAILFVKLSVLLLLYQIFAVNKTMRYLIHFGVVFQALFYLAVTGVYSATEVICVTGANITAYLCTHQWPLAIAQGVINTVTDLYVLVLPLAMVMRLQLSPKRKVGIIAIFMTGLL